jgi:hypothetical protein
MHRAVAAALSIASAGCLLAGCGSTSPATTAPIAQGVAAINASSVFHGALTMSYKFGATGCALHVVSSNPGIFEYDNWYPNSAGQGGGATTFTIRKGVAAVRSGMRKPESWRPPGGANCTIHSDGTIAVP